LNIHQIEALYIHFPFCRHLCNYCDFYKNVHKNRDQELDSFETSIVEGYSRFMGEFESKGYQIESLNTLYLGGGTPSLWGERGARFLQKFLLERNIKLGSDCEFTLEVNPAAWTKEGLESFISTGVNRFSLGIQTLNPNFLKVIDRIHNIDDVYETLKYFKNLNVSFSVDFMIGLPFSEEMNRGIISELEEILTFSPEHISLYILTTKAGYIHKSELPSEEYIEREYLAVSDFLRSKGYDHYEVSNFSLPKKESRHNLKYWNSESVMSLGVSATGYLREISTRYKWLASKSDYSKEVLSSSEKKLEDVYMALRINRPIDLSMYIENIENLKNLISKWDEQGLLGYRDETSISLNSRGFLILDSLLDDMFKFNLL
jgi:oxygen-independent coproporphyrinogen-3 oxidase